MMQKITFPSIRTFFTFEVVAISFVINILGLTLPIVTLQIYDRVLAHQAVHTATMLLLGAFLAVVFEGLFRFLRFFLLSIRSRGYEETIPVQYADAVLTASRGAMIDGATIYHGNYRLASLRDFFSGQAFVAYFDVPFLFIYLFTVWYIGNVLVVIPIFLLGVSFLTMKLFDLYGKKSIAQKSSEERKRFKVLTTTFRHLLAFKRKVHKEHPFHELHHSSRNFSSATMTYEQQQLALREIITVISQMSTILMVAVGAYLVIMGHITTGALAACSIISGRIFAPVQSLLATRLRKDDGVDGLREVQTIVAEFGIDNSTGEGESVSSGSLEIFENDQELVWGVIPEGSRCLIFNEAEKLHRSLLFVQEGQEKLALLGGVDVYEYLPRVRYQKIAFVGTPAELFVGTLLENLTFFEATLETQAKALAQKLGLEDFIYTLTDGYSTAVGRETVAPFEDSILLKIAIVRSLVVAPLVVYVEKIGHILDIPSQNLFAKLLSDLPSDVTLLLDTQATALQQVTTHTLSVGSSGELSIAVREGVAHE